MGRSPMSNEPNKTGQQNIGHYPTRQEEGYNLNIKLPHTWELLIKVFMQFGAVGIICYLLIIGYENFHLAFKESNQTHREELKEFRNQLEKQREYDQATKKVFFEALRVLSDKLDNHINTLENTNKAMDNQVRALEQLNKELRTLINNAKKGTKPCINLLL